MKEFVKTPNEVLDYGWDFSKWLPAGVVIESSVWIVDAGITVVTQANDDTTTEIFLSAGTLAGRYECTNRVSGGGRTAERTFAVTIVEKRYA